MLTAVIDGQSLVITVPLQKPTTSKSGKSQIVASSNGFVATTAVVAGKAVKVSVNAII